MLQKTGWQQQEPETGADKWYSIQKDNKRLCFVVLCSICNIIHMKNAFEILVIHFIFLVASLHL